ncbi:TMEM165/GDT1 family protein [Nocardioides pacificus]
MDLVVVALTFAAIFVVELPDKTFLATLVLSTKFRPLYVWIGVGLAFTVQVGIAVALGKAAALLPEDLVQGAAALLFLAGAVLLLREARSHDAADDGSEFAEKAPAAQGWKAIGASFLVLFAAEWGDLSQLLTLSLVAKYDDPVSVFVGSLGALLTVSGLAVLVGRWLLGHVKLSVLHYVGAAVCLALAALTTYDLLR